MKNLYLFTYDGKTFIVEAEKPEEAREKFERSHPDASYIVDEYVWCGYCEGHHPIGAPCDGPLADK